MTTVAISVTRSDLGLASLNINDHLDYKVGSEILGSMVTYDKKKVSSPYVNGDITVHRRRGNVNEKFSVYVYGADQAELRTNTIALIEAFSQNQFNLIITLDSVEYSYQCEASDYQIGWSNAHMFSKQVLVTFNLDRKPIALVGV
jgi:hypothetical protein